MPNGVACLSRDCASPGGRPPGIPPIFGGSLPRQTPWAPELGQCGGYLLCLHWPGWIAAIADQPFEFDAYALRWAGLEADPVDVRFRVSLSEARPPDHDLHPTRWFCPVPGPGPCLGPGYPHDTP